MYTSHYQNNRYPNIEHYPSIHAKERNLSQNSSLADGIDHGQTKRVSLSDLLRFKLCHFIELTSYLYSLKIQNVHTFSNRPYATVCIIWRPKSI